MTRNPYAHHKIDLPDDEAPQRVSGLAVASLVFGLLCCIPGVGLIGTILGGAALVRISGSQGRLSGRGMAMGGLLLGLLGTIAYIAMTLGLMYSLNGLTVYGDTLGAVQAGDHAKVRAMLSPSTSAAVTDERIDQFAAEVGGAVGQYRGIPKGLGQWAGGYMALGQQIEAALNQIPVASSRKIPIPTSFDKGRAIVIFVIDPSTTGNRGAARVEDIAVVEPGGNLIRLVPTGAPAPPPQAPPSGTPAATGVPEPAPTGSP